MRTLSNRGMILLATVDTTDMMVVRESVRSLKERRELINNPWQLSGYKVTQ